MKITKPVGISLDIPEPRPVSSGGGAWSLQQDRVENWAWMSDLFTPDELDAIVEMGNRVELERATTHGPQNLEVRDSFVQFLFPNEVTTWVFAKLAGAITAANQQWFGFDLTGMEQGLQFTRYTAPGEHYAWHIDRGQNAGVRKLSLSLQLSDPNDYEGGDLELWFGGEPFKADRRRGVVTFFPSWTMHRVTPVTRGTRHSLVAWISGPSFR